MQDEHELTVLEKRVFGSGATRDEKTGRLFETGVGAHPKNVQAKIFAREAQLGRRMNFAETQAFLRDGIAE